MKPTTGRIVHYYHAEAGDEDAPVTTEPLAAIVARVYADGDEDAPVTTEPLAAIVARVYADGDEDAPVTTEPLAAIVARVYADELIADLVVFSVDGDAYYLRRVSYSGKPAGDRWSWPPRV